METTLTPANPNDLMSPEFREQVKKFKADWTAFYQAIGTALTPRFDGEGNEIIKKRDDGYEYIIESYMRKALDLYFPGWSWEMAAPLHFLGAEWVVAQGHLVIVDEYLLFFHVVPPLRRYYGSDAVRIQYGRGKPHEPENIVDIGDQCQQANTAALKRAINRLTGIGDDVYRKRIEMEGAGSLKDLFLRQPDGSLLLHVVQDEFGISLPSRVWVILSRETGHEIKSMADIESKIGWREAYDVIVRYQQKGR